MKNFFLIIFSLLAFCSCKKFDSETGNNNNNSTQPPVDTTTTAVSFFAKGADVSWLTQMEALGVKFFCNSRTLGAFNNSGKPTVL